MGRQVWAVVLVAGLVPGLAWSDDDEHERQERHGGGVRASATTAVDPTYAKECGSCHVAYPARFLPAASWVRLMGGLADHFGDNAELAPEVQAAVTGWLVANAADRGTAASTSPASASPATAPLRITELGWFRREHSEFPASWVAEPAIRSLANCAACHTRAAEGSYREGEIRIPGHGGWED